MELAAHFAAGRCAGHGHRFAVLAGSPDSARARFCLVSRAHAKKSSPGYLGNSLRYRLPAVAGFLLFPYSSILRCYAYGQILAGNGPGVCHAGRLRATVATNGRELSSTSRGVTGGTGCVPALAPHPLFWKCGAPAGKHTLYGPWPYDAALSWVGVPTYRSAISVLICGRNRSRRTRDSLPRRNLPGDRRFAGLLRAVEHTGSGARPNLVR